MMGVGVMVKKIHIQLNHSSSRKRGLSFADHRKVNNLRNLTQKLALSSFFSLLFLLYPVLQAKKNIAKASYKYDWQKDTGIESQVIANKKRKRKLSR